jgi:hypothetical protein
MTKLLLASGANPLLADHEQRLSIHLAVGNTSVKNFVLLVKEMGSRLDVNAQDKVRGTFLLLVL